MITEHIFSPTDIVVLTTETRQRTTQKNTIVLPNQTPRHRYRKLSLIGGVGSGLPKELCVYFDFVITTGICTASTNHILNKTCQMKQLHRNIFPCSDTKLRLKAEVSLKVHYHVLVASKKSNLVSILVLLLGRVGPVL